MPPSAEYIFNQFERAGCILGDDSCHQKFSYNGSIAAFFSRLIAIAVGLLAGFKAVMTDRTLCQ